MTGLLLLLGSVLMIGALAGADDGDGDGGSNAGDDGGPDALGPFPGTTDGADLLVGGDDDDFIDALGGDDTVQGNGGSDLIQGGAGSDVLYGAGKLEAIIDEDRTFVERFADLEDGAVDTLQGGAGGDVLFLGAGDVATGGIGSDIFAADVGIVPETQTAVSRVTDFVEGEDFFAIDFGPGGNPGLIAADIAARQSVTAAGVLISFDAGDSQDILLAGLTRVLSADSFLVST